ncbi:MAG: hypothetical protein HY904_11545 [Deltaproteobacteria bacterium]|nr:hypothetical protein [Deltaproteobacteria bacterium]
MTDHVLALFCLLSVAVYGCSEEDEPRPDPADYDQSCAQHADCVAVYNGCGGCDCHPAGAVNASELVRFQQDDHDARCGRRPPWAPSCSCLEATAWCVDGKCKAIIEGVEDAGLPQDGDGGTP